MKNSAFALTLVLTASILFSPILEADILWFKNGRSLEGAVRDLPDGKVEIVLPYGTLAFSRAQVDHVEKALSVADIVSEALATLRPTDAERLFELAEWCREKNEYTLAQQLYRKVLVIDPEHGGARQRLGYERQGGEWLTQKEARLARGEVPFRGRWVRKADLDRALAAERAQSQKIRRLDLEEARLALEFSRLELEAQRVNQRPTTQGLPLYPYASGFVHSPGAGLVPPRGPRANLHPPLADPLPQAAGAQERTEKRRHTASIPRHQRGGFVAPKRR